MTTSTDQREAALKLIREMAAQGHAYSYIARALDIARIETPSGRPGTRWDRKAVYRLAQAHGIAVGFSRAVAC